jgi:hypothetical protein
VVKSNPGEITFSKKKKKMFFPKKILAGRERVWAHAKLFFFF